MIPKEALRYLQNKKLSPAFSYKDIWNEEHATNFTVAKAMQLDVLKDIKDAVEAAIADGQTFEQFRENLEPTLIKKKWWGKKEMTDPLTGEIVNAQLGSDRRLKTIYDTNLRSAYQEGRWERAQESTAHPYLMYRVGPSKEHRKEHLAWDGLVLPKDDPWWNSHYPPNGWGCKCWTMAVSEDRKQRLEQTGISVPPTADGQSGHTVRVRTQAPPEDYRNFYNERKGIIERVPTGVDPAFNWNQGMMGRDTPIIQGVLRTANETVPESFEAIAETLMTNKISIEKYHGFIQQSLNKTANPDKAFPVGFLDRKTIRYLRDNKDIGIDLSNNNVIVLESKLINAKKYTDRHARQGNAPSESDWLNLVEYLIDAQIYYDDGSLIFLRKMSEVKFIKIAVDLAIKTNIKANRGVKPFLPKVDSMYLIDIATEHPRGSDSYRDILKLPKIR